MAGNIVGVLGPLYHVNYQDCVTLDGYLMSLLRTGQSTSLFDEMYRRHVLGVVRDVDNNGGQEDIEVVEELFWDYLYQLNGKPGEK